MEENRDFARYQLSKSQFYFSCILIGTRIRRVMTEDTHFDGSVTRGRHDVFIIKVYYIDSSTVANQNTA